MRTRQLLPVMLPVVAIAAGIALVACKSGGSTGSGTASSASLFERQPKRGDLGFIVRTGLPGQSIGDVEVDFKEVTVSDAGPSPDLDGGKAPDCEPVAIGPCVVTSCVQGTPVGGGQSKSVAPAGDITITDTTSGGSQVFTAGTNGYQYTGQSPVNARPGDAITFSAAGGEAPAFTQTLVAPQPITPAFIPCQDAAADASSSACSISRSQDLTVSWSGGDQGQAVFTLSAFGAGCNNAQSCPPLQSTAACTFDVGAGTGVIPKDVLARFPEASVQFAYFAESSVVFNDGDFLIRATAATQTQTQTQNNLLLTQ